MVLLKLFDRVPQTGLTHKVRAATSKQKTPRLQVIRTFGTSEDPHLYGSISITPREAALGTRKLVNIPWGFHSRIFRVVIPPRIKEGATLRLAGLGKVSDLHRGDLHLKVLIEP
jgi:DnaJ-class molecular chaperone